MLTKNICPIISRKSGQIQIQIQNSKFKIQVRPDMIDFALRLSSYIIGNYRRSFLRQ